jgi:hypothetical protein
MAWSRKTLEATGVGTKGTANTSVARGSEKGPHKRIAKRAMSAGATAPVRTDKTDNLQTALAAPVPSSRRTLKTETAPVNVKTRDPEPALTTSPKPPPATDLEHVRVPPTANTDTGNSPRARSPQELVLAALAVAEQITKAEAPSKLDDAHTTGIRASDADASRPLVALLLSRPDVKSAADLKGLNVAIDVTQPAAVERDIRRALEALGATDVQLSVSDAKPLDRLVGGNVEAEVIRIVSADAAEAFPDIKGFKVLRLPLLAR